MYVYANTLNGRKEKQKIDNANKGSGTSARQVIRAAFVVLPATHSSSSLRLHFVPERI